MLKKKATGFFKVCEDVCPLNNQLSLNLHSWPVISGRDNGATFGYYENYLFIKSEKSAVR